MNFKEMIKCHDNYKDVKKQIGIYLNSYMETIINKILELSSEYTNIMFFKNSDECSVEFNFYEYTILIKKSDSFGVPEEINKTHQNITIKDIADGKNDIFCGCISIFYLDPNFDGSKYNLLSNLYINNEGVYKMGKVLSGGKNTFKDDCKSILVESIGSIFTNTCPVFPVSEEIKLK